VDEPVTILEILRSVTLSYQAGFELGLEKKPMPPCSDDVHQQAAALGQRHALEAATFFEAVMKAAEAASDGKGDAP
jgi:hypothetical protein